MGFNTDLSKAQVITKDEDKVLDAELHTDLLNQSERDKIAEAGEKIAEAGEKIGDLAGALANSNDGGIFNTYKENRFGNLLNDYIKKSGVSGLFLDDKISLEDKRNALNNLVEGFLKDRGYTGPMPEIHIGSESFAVDSSKGIGEKIFISQDLLTSGNVLQILGHELGHLAKYDKDEKTADNVGNKVEEIKAGEEKDYNEYLASIKDKYKDLPSLEESKELEGKIPDEYKEKKVHQAIRGLDFDEKLIEIDNDDGKIKKQFKVLTNSAITYAENTAGHQYFIVSPDNQEQFFNNGKLKQEYIEKGYPNPIFIDGKYGWTIGAFNIEDKLKVEFNQETDVKIMNEVLKNTAKNHGIKGELNTDSLKSEKYTDDSQFIEKLFEYSLNYKSKEENSPTYSAIPGNIPGLKNKYNCNSFFQTMVNLLEVNNKKDFTNIKSPGEKQTIPEEFFKKEKKNE